MRLFSSLQSDYDQYGKHISTYRADMLHILSICYSPKVTVALVYSNPFSMAICVPYSIVAHLIHHTFSDERGKASVFISETFHTRGVCTGISAFPVAHS